MKLEKPDGRGNGSRGMDRQEGIEDEEWKEIVHFNRGRTGDDGSNRCLAYGYGEERRGT